MATMGIDIGTFQSKGVIVDDAGTVLAQATRSHEMLVPRPGWAEHRPEEDWWQEVCGIARELVERTGPGAVEALAVSAIGPCMVPVGPSGAALTNAVLYGVDNRAAAQVARLNEAIGEDRLLERCGSALTSQSVGPKILWLREEQAEVFARTARVHSATGYVVERLTGEAVMDHYTAAGFAPLYDIERQCWSDALAGDIVPLDRLPRLAWSGEIAGQLTAEAAAATGLAAGTPVTVGTIDAAAEAVSVGVTRPGDVMVMYGSTIFMIALTPERLRDARLWTAPWLFEGQTAAMAGLATSGTLTHWFRDQFARELDPGRAFAALAAEAEARPPGAGGLIFLPYFSGERTPIHDPRARGAWFGLNLTHTRGDLYRALLEGIACGTAHVIETLREAGAPPDALHAVGGGVQNRLWLQATSDLGGVRQTVHRISVGASYGDAWLAARALGAAPDISAWNPPEREVVPVGRPEYARLYPLFKALYLATRDIAHALAD